MGRTQTGKALKLLTGDLGTLPKLEEVFTVLRKGTSLIKYGRQGNPKYHFFRIVEGMLVWESKGQKKCVMLSRVLDLQLGQNTPVFKKHRDQSLEHLSFSLEYRDDRNVVRTLDLVCPRDEVYQIWIIGLFKLLEQQRQAAEQETSGRRRSQVQQAESSSVAETSFGGEGKEAVESAFFSGDANVENWFPDGLPAQNSGISDANASSISQKPSAALLDTPPGDLYVFGKLGTLHFSHPQHLEGSLKLDIKQAACSDRMAVIITRKGQVYTVGDDLGLRTCSLSPNALAMAAGFKAAYTACSAASAFVISSEDGSIRSWGLNQAGQLGPWNVKGVFHLRTVPNLLKIQQISCSPTHVGCISESGQLYTWGDGYGGKLGHGNYDFQQTPKLVEALAPVNCRWVSCGHFHTCVVGSKGYLYSWGGDFCYLQREIVGNAKVAQKKKDNHKGCLGNGSLEGCSIPQKVDVDGVSELGVREVCCGEYLTVILDEEGWVYQTGRMGVQGSRAPWEGCKVFYRVGGLLKDLRVDKVSCGDGHVAVIASRVGIDANTEGPLLLTWGRGESGQLGIGIVEGGSVNPSIVEDVKGERLRNVVCGGNATMVLIDYNQNTALLKASQESVASVKRALSRNKLTVTIPQTEFDCKLSSTPTPFSTPLTTARPPLSPTPLVQSYPYLAGKPPHLRRRSNWSFLTSTQWQKQHQYQVKRRPLDDIERSHNSYSSVYDDATSRTAEPIFHSEHGSRQSYNRQVWNMSPVSTTSPTSSNDKIKSLFSQRSLTPPAMGNSNSSVNGIPAMQHQNVPSEISEEDYSERPNSPSAKSDSYAIGSYGAPVGVGLGAENSQKIITANSVFPSLDLSACTFRMTSQDQLPRVTSLNPHYSEVDFNIDIGVVGKQVSAGSSQNGYVKEGRTVQLSSPLYSPSFGEKSESQKRHQLKYDNGENQKVVQLGMLNSLSEELVESVSQLSELTKQLQSQQNKEIQHICDLRKSINQLEQFLILDSDVKIKHHRSLTQDSWSQVDFGNQQDTSQAISQHARKASLSDRVGYQEVEVENGVFITLTQGQSGENKLVRLRFSKSWKQRQQDIDSWWQCNRYKIMQQYNISNSVTDDADPNM